MASDHFAMLEGEFLEDFLGAAEKDGNVNTDDILDTADSDVDASEKLIVDSWWLGRVDS